MILFDNKLGSIEEILIRLSASISSNDLIKSKKSWIYKQIELISKKFKFSLDDPIKKIPKKGMNAILYGLKDEIVVENKSIGVNIDYLISFEGISNFIVEQYQNNESIRLKRWAKN